MCQFDLRLRSNRGDWIRTSDRSAPSRVRYQTAPRPEAGDRTRTGTESLEGSCATVTPRPRGSRSLAAGRALEALSKPPRTRVSAATSGPAAMTARTQDGVDVALT